MKRVLVRGTNWIGDGVMTLPALRELRRLYPETHITLMVRRWVRGLFEGLDCIDALLECDDGPGTWARLRGNVRKMREGAFDTLLLLPNALAPALQAALAGIPTRLGYAVDGRSPLLSAAPTKSSRLQGRHQCYHYLDLLRALGLSPIDYLSQTGFRPDTRLPWTLDDKTAAAATAAQFGVAGGRPLVGINAGAFYGSAKRWSPERYAQVADALAESPGVQILLLGSQAERPIAERIASNMKHPAVSVAGRTVLRELLHLLSCCHLLITNDSGPMHLAAALDVPLVALFGSTDIRATAPVSARARVVRKEVACNPCLLRECPLDLRCFRLITVDEVVTVAREQLRLYGTEIH